MNGAKYICPSTTSFLNSSPTSVVLMVRLPSWLTAAPTFNLVSENHSIFASSVTPTENESDPSATT